MAADIKLTKIMRRFVFRSTRCCLCSSASEREKCSKRCKWSLKLFSVSQQHNAANFTVQYFLPSYFIMTSQINQKTKTPTNLNNKRGSFWFLKGQWETECGLKSLQSQIFMIVMTFKSPRAWRTRFPRLQCKWNAKACKKVVSLMEINANFHFWLISRFPSLFFWHPVASLSPIRSGERFVFCWQLREWKRRRNADKTGQWRRKRLNNSWVLFVNWGQWMFIEKLWDESY